MMMPTATARAIAIVDSATVMPAARSSAGRYRFADAVQGCEVSSGVLPCAPTTVVALNNRAYNRGWSSFQRSHFRKIASRRPSRIACSRMASMRSRKAALDGARTPT
jgi:hypothetical protein